MLYRAIGLMSGSSLDGLDVVFAEFHFNAGKWSYEIKAADCLPYSEEWIHHLQSATSLSALDYQLLHTRYGHYVGQQVKNFIDTHQLHFKVGLIASHGHTTFHVPGEKMTAQLGDGAAIAAATHLPVVADLRAMDVAFGGQGAPIVPIGEKLLLNEYQLFLNIGGIANVTINHPERYIAFDICPANRVLNMICGKTGKAFDDGGQMAASGSINSQLLSRLNGLPYYTLPYPKSLANDFGTHTVFPIVESFALSPEDALRTYVEHIVHQVKMSVSNAALPVGNTEAQQVQAKMLVTGGGAFNTFLINRLSEELQALNIEVVVPDEKLVMYKEALIMALIGVLRWRQENNVLSSVTGATQDSIGGALWMGSDA